MKMEKVGGRFHVEKASFGKNPFVETIRRNNRQLVEGMLKSLESGERSGYLQLLREDGRAALVFGISTNVSSSGALGAWFALQLLLINGVKELLAERLGKGNVKVICEVDDDFWYGESGAPLAFSREFSERFAGVSMLRAPAPSSSDLSSEGLNCREFLSEEDAETLAELASGGWDCYATFGFETAKRGIESLQARLGIRLEPDVYLRISNLFSGDYGPEPLSSCLYSTMKERRFYNSGMENRWTSKGSARSLITPVCEKCGNADPKTITSRVSLPNQGNDFRISYKCVGGREVTNRLDRSVLRISGCGNSSGYWVKPRVPFSIDRLGTVIRAPFWAEFSWPNSFFQLYGGSEFPRLMSSTRAILRKRENNPPFVALPAFQIKAPKQNKDYPGDEVSALRFVEKFGIDGLFEAVAATTSFRIVNSPIPLKGVKICP